MSSKSMKICVLFLNIWKVLRGCACLSVTPFFASEGKRGRWPHLVLRWTWNNATSLIWGELHSEFSQSLRTKRSMLQVNIWANNETKAGRCCLLLHRIMQEVIQGWKEDENEIVLKFRIQNLNNYIVRIWQPSDYVSVSKQFHNEHENSLSC